MDQAGRSATPKKKGASMYSRTTLTENHVTDDRSQLLRLRFRHLARIMLEQTFPFRNRRFQKKSRVSSLPNIPNNRISNILHAAPSRKRVKTDPEDEELDLRAVDHTLFSDESDDAYSTVGARQLTRDAAGRTFEKEHPAYRPRRYKDSSARGPTRRAGNQYIFLGNDQPPDPLPKPKAKPAKKKAITPSKPPPQPTREEILLRSRRLLLQRY
jgi:hypothetical protein